MKQFLLGLKKRLYFLSEEERVKVINKYKKEIEKRLDNEESLKEVINSYDYEQIVKEVCDDYKLSYEFCNRKSKLDKDITHVSHLIGDFIRDIIKVVRKTSNTFSLQDTLEVLIKVIVLVFLFLLVKIPINLVIDFIMYLTSNIFYPFDHVIYSFLRILFGLVYLITCLMITLKVFGTYNLPRKKIVDEKKLKSVDKEFNWLDTLIRFAVYIFILLPLFILTIVGIVITVESSFLVASGVKLIGVPMIFAGLTCLLISVISSVMDSLNNKGRSSIIGILLSLFIFALGMIATGVSLERFEYYEMLNTSNLKSTTEEVEVELDSKNTVINAINGKYEVEIDDELEDNVVKVEVTYYDQYVDITYDKLLYGEQHVLEFNSHIDKDPNYYLIVKAIVKDLKDGKIYSYGHADEYKVVIYANSETKKYLGDF